MYARKSIQVSLKIPILGPGKVYISFAICGETSLWEHCFTGQRKKQERCVAGTTRMTNKNQNKKSQKPHYKLEDMCTLVLERSTDPFLLLHYS